MSTTGVCRTCESRLTSRESGAPFTVSANRSRSGSMAGSPSAFDSWNFGPPFPTVSMNA